MPQFDIQHLEDNNHAKICLNRVLKFMNSQLENTPNPIRWSTTPQNAAQFILELQQNPQHTDEKLQDFIAWCGIIMFNTKKLHHTDHSQLMKLVAATYQCNTISKVQSRRINGLNILRIALLMFSLYLSGVELSSDYKNSKRNPLIVFMLTNALVISYLKQQLVKKYILANRDTTEAKKIAFITWLSKVAEYITNLKLTESHIADSLEKDSTPNLTEQFRNKRRLSNTNLAPQVQADRSFPSNFGKVLI
jgi:hypothetical protein